MTTPGLFLAVLLLLPLSHGHTLLFELPEVPGSQALRIGKPGEPEISFLNIMARMSAGHSGSLPLCVDWPLASYFEYGDSDPNLSLPGPVSDLHPLLDENKPLLVWEGHSQKITFNFSQPPIPEDFFWLDRYIHQPWRIYNTKDRQGQTIYYWYDQQGNRHVISQQEYWLMLARLFESWLHRLYPEIFGPPLPAGGGWHVWVYTQRKPPQGRQASGRGKGGKDLGASGRDTGASGRDTGASGRDTGASGRSTGASGRSTGASARDTNASVKAADTIASLVKEFQTGVLQQAVERFGENYNGKYHREFCIRIKNNVTQQRRKPLSLQEKQQLKPFITHLSEIVESCSFDARSISTCIHSLTSSRLLYPLRQDGKLTQAIQALTEALLNRVTQESYFDEQGVANLLWALAKLVENGLDHGLANGAVTALLPQVVQMAQGEIRQTGFTPKEIVNLLWALAKLVEKGLGLGQASEAVTALLPQVVQVAQRGNHLAGFTSQGVANLLWAVAKLVENGLDQGQANEAVAALLPQVVQVILGGDRQAKFIPQHLANLLWALAKLVENGLDYGQTNGAVTALLQQVAQEGSYQAGFNPQHVANLLWALAKLVEYGLDHWQANGAVTALLSQVVRVAQGRSHKVGLKPQEIANLLWALAKLVENGLDHGQANGVVTVLLPQVVQVAQGGSHQTGFKPQEIANLLWALALLGESIELETINEILASLSFSEQYSVAQQAQLLWSFMVFMAREVSISDQLKSYMSVWYQALNQQAAINELATILAMAAVWLDLEGNFNPSYEPNISSLQRKFKRMLVDRYSNIEIKEEYSLSQLPPVDFYLPEHRVAIEVQGPRHFTDRELLSKTGRTILKVKTYKKLDIHVIEVPYKDINSDKLKWFWDQLLQLLISKAQQPQASDPDAISSENGSSDD